MKLSSTGTWKPKRLRTTEIEDVDVKLKGKTIQQRTLHFRQFRQAKFAYGCSILSFFF